MAEANERPTVRFPILERLRVVDYGMFPGHEGEGGLEATFEPGLTFVLGANGLGKTTLVRMLYRLLAGPYDITGLERGGALGQRTLEAKKISSRRRKVFAERVFDGAEAASAELEFRLGDHSIVVERGLANLGLTKLVLDGQEQPNVDEGTYQHAITEMASLWSFGDWILLLRHLTFYFEDRRELVWDPSAQIQLLRLLFLSPDTAKSWTETERRVLALDSRVRNLKAVVTKEQNELTKGEDLQEASVDVKGELATLTDLQLVDEARREELAELEADQDEARHAARLGLLKLEQEREQALRALEHAKLVALSERFPDSSETARYIFAQLMAEDECLVCGSDAAEVAEDLEARIKAKQCVVCGKDLSDRTVDREGTDLSDRRVAKARKELDKADRTLEAASSRLIAAEKEYTDVRVELQELNAAITTRQSRIESLLRRLPPEEAALIEKRDELAQMKRREASLREELTVLRSEFASFIEGVTESLVAKAPRIRDLFNSYARDFLLEECELAWQPRKERVGQTGAAIEFPAFELDLGSAAFPSKVRRTGPEQVSESQREFIDLSFRMALMGAADEDAGATLVVDAPESSLDAVFVHRAADVLGRFASPDLGNRLVLTSNLTEGALIPRLLAQMNGDAASRLVDLLDLAEPTAAIRELSQEYKDIREKMLPDIGINGPNE